MFKTDYITRQRSRVHTSNFTYNARYPQCEIEDSEMLVRAIDKPFVNLRKYQSNLALLTVYNRVIVHDLLVKLSGEISLHNVAIEQKSSSHLRHNLRRAPTIRNEVCNCPSNGLVDSSVRLWLHGSN